METNTDYIVAVTYAELWIGLGMAAVLAVAAWVVMRIARSERPRCEVRAE